MPRAEKPATVAKAIHETILTASTTRASRAVLRMLASAVKLPQILIGTGYVARATTEPEAVRAELEQAVTHRLADVRPTWKPLAILLLVPVSATVLQSLWVGYCQ